MNWDYIAGFFDGEGYVGTGARSLKEGGFRATIEIVQSAERGRKLLEQMKQFLAEEGIISHKIRERVYTNGNLPLYVLRINKQASVKDFLNKIRPLSHIKQTEVERVWQILQARLA